MCIWQTARTPPSPSTWDKGGQRPCAQLIARASENGRKRTPGLLLLGCKRAACHGARSLTHPRAGGDAGSRRRSTQPSTSPSRLPSRCGCSVTSRVPGYDFIGDVRLMLNRPNQDKILRSTFAERLCNPTEILVPSGHLMQHFLPLESDFRLLRTGLW